MTTTEETKWKKYYLGPEKSTILIRIGPMGSGKTTATNIYISQELGYSDSVFQLIDLDKMVTESEEYIVEAAKIEEKLLSIDESQKHLKKSEWLSNLWGEVNRKINGYKLINSITSFLIEKRRHFSTESTGSFFCPNRKKIIEAYKNGYDTMAIFTFLPYFKLLDRVRQRAITEGRDVLEEELEENVLNALSKSTENLYITNNFYFLDTNVSKDEKPNLLLHTQIDFDNKKDFDNCIKIAGYNFDNIQYLLNVIQANEKFYTSSNKIKIYEAELLFLKTLMSIASAQIPEQNSSQPPSQPPLENDRVSVKRTKHIINY